MPFIVTREQPRGKLYAARFPDGEIGWQPNKDKATRFDEPEADKIAADINKYAFTKVTVEGVR